MAQNDKNNRNRQPLNQILATDDPDYPGDGIVEIKNLDKLGPGWEGWTVGAQKKNVEEVNKIKANAAKMTADSLRAMTASYILNGEERMGEFRITLGQRPELAEDALDQVNKMTLVGTPKVLESATYALRDIADTRPDLTTDALEIMKRSLASPEGDARSSALNAISLMVYKRPDMSEEFLKLADDHWKDANPRVRAEAMNVYTEIGRWSGDAKMKQAVLDRAKAGINDADDDVRGQAYGALPLILDQQPNRAFEVLEMARAGTTNVGKETREGAWDAIKGVADMGHLDSGTSSKIFEMSKAALNDPNAYVRRDATDIIGRIAYLRPDLAPSAMESLKTKSNDPDELVKRNAEVGLESIQYHHPELFPAGQGTKNNAAEERRQSLPVQPRFPKP